MDILLQYMLQVQQSEHANIINFLAIVLLIVILRYSLAFIGKRFVERRNLGGSDVYPFIQSLLNWGTFYAVLISLIMYFSEDDWLTDKGFNIGTTKITLLSVIIAVIILTLGFRISQFVTRFVLQPTLRKYGLDTGIQYTFTRMTHYIIIVIAVLLSMTNIGLDLSALTVFASVVGVGVGFGLQNIASNFISGIILLFERPIKLGDVVEVDGDVVVVEEIKMRATIVKTFDNERIIIPNSQFIENKIVNWSYGDKMVRVVIPIGVAYGSNTYLVRDLLLQAASKEESILNYPAPSVDFLNFGESSLDFRLVVWVDSPDYRLLAKSNLLYKINDLFIEHGIEIPFPQRDLHVRSLDHKIVEQIRTGSK